MEPTCTGPNCTRHARAKKDPPLCQAHYYQWRRKVPLTDLSRPLQRDLICAFEGCGKQARSKGWCRTHSDHIALYGEAVPIGSRTGKRSHLCHEPGCGERTTYKYCPAHLPTAGQECEALGCTNRALGTVPYCPTHVRKDRSLRHFYGISLRQRDALAVAQGLRCAICDAEVALHVDHCHDTGRVRGMLCGPCNRGIGLLRHDLSLLRSAVSYLGGE